MREGCAGGAGAGNLGSLASVCSCTHGGGASMRAGHDCRAYLGTLGSSACVRNFTLSAGAGATGQCGSEFFYCTYFCVFYDGGACTLGDGTAGVGDFGIAGSNISSN